jgi:hypothetical protein
MFTVITSIMKTAPTPNRVHFTPYVVSKTDV